MAGVVLEAFSLRTWDFSGLQTSLAEEYCILRDVPVETYGEAQLLVRIHTRTISNPSSKIEVRILESAPSSEDPALLFEGTELALATVPAGTTAPELVVASFSAPFAGFVNVLVKGTQGSAGTSIVARLSAAIVLKE